jgi:uncharacterized protein
MRRIPILKILESRLYREVTCLLLLIVCICGACQSKGSKLTPERFFDGQSLELARAIQHGDTAKIEACIRAGADPNSPGRRGVTPLYFAYGVGQKKAMVTLLEHGADPNVRITAPEGINRLANESAVTLVAGTRDNDYLRILLDHGGDLNAKNSGGEPIVETMILKNSPNYEGMRMLLDRGADIDATDKSGNSLLMNLALLRDFEQVYYLLQRGADFRKKDIGGFDVSNSVFRIKINQTDFPEAFEWQRKCKEFLLAHGMKDPGPPKPKTPEEEAEWQRIYNKALDADIKRHGG